MIENALINYGGIGLFCAYLIYDRQILLKKITQALNGLTHAIEKRDMRPISL